MASMAQLEQCLVRFQNRTHVIVLTNHHDRATTASIIIRQYLSTRTGWPVSRIELVHHDMFCQARVISAICGGKGGFGTLLKGQSRQAGAQSTTNWGACRDLQGRRLSAVNDQIAFQEWQLWQDKIDRGLATIDDMAQALTNTPTGVAGWYLQAPAWAHTSKQDRRMWQQQLVRFTRQQQAIRGHKEQARQRHDQQVQSYVHAADAATAQVRDSLRGAMQQGLSAAAARRRPTKKAKTMTLMPPEALMTMTGDMVVAYEHDHWRVQSKSNFGTAALALRPRSRHDMALYFEIVLVSGGLVQVGWALPGFAPSSDRGDGVGDDDLSWAYDGSRGISLHGGDSASTTTSSYGETWQADAVIGCLLDANGTMSFAVNGNDLGPAFCIDAAQCGQVFPAVSCNPGEIVELRWTRSDFQHLPAHATPVGDFLATEDAILGAAIMDDDDEDPAPDRVGQETVDETPVMLESKARGNEKAAPPASTEYFEIDLDRIQSAAELAELDMDHLKAALVARGVKCGGTLEQRAERLFSLRGLSGDQYPPKLLAKK